MEHGFGGEARDDGAGSGVINNNRASFGGQTVKRKPLSTSSNLMPTTYDNDPVSPIISEQRISSDISHEVPKQILTSTYNTLGSEEERNEKDGFIAPHTTQRQNSSFRGGNWWIMEILSCILSLIAVAAMIIVLKIYDGKALPDWPIHITLNTFLALFTTLGKAGLMIPITEAISQLKWVWFAETERPLNDFQKFDEASRGPIGSLKLLGRLKGRNPACIGALVSVLGLATSPFTQQVVTYPTRNVPIISGSQIQRSDYFMGYESLRGNVVPLADQPMKQAVQYGLFQAINDTIVDVAPTCATGSCTWTSYSSLGVCARVANVTDQLTVMDVPGNFSATVRYIVKQNVTLRNGVFLQAGGRVMNISSLAGAGTENYAWSRYSVSQPSFSFTSENDKNTTIVDFFIIYMQNYTTSNIQYKALEVSFNWCVNTYETKVENGIATTTTIANSTKILSTIGTRVAGDFNQDLVLEAADSSANETTSSNYTVDSHSSAALEQYMRDIFAGFYEIGHSQNISTDAAGVMIGVLYGTPTSSSAELDDVQFESMNNATQNLATSMTNNIRQRQFRGDPAPGTAYTSETFVRVRWGWLAYLLSLLALSFFFLFATIIKSQTANVDVFKSSALAAMCGLSDHSRAAMGIHGIQNRTEDKAKDVMVRLGRGEGGWCFESARI